jgi:hypothetical protein
VSDDRIVAADTPEGMLREAHDILMVGVARFRNTTFAFVADDLVRRIAEMYPDPADVVERQP